MIGKSRMSLASAVLVGHAAMASTIVQDGFMSFLNRKAENNNSYPPGFNKYPKPHQGKKECARRIRQGLAGK